MRGEIAASVNTTKKNKKINKRTDRAGLNIVYIYVYIYIYMYMHTLTKYAAVKLFCHLILMYSLSFRPIL